MTASETMAIAGLTENSRLGPFLGLGLEMKIAGP